VTTSVVAIGAVAAAVLVAGTDVGRSAQLEPTTWEGPSAPDLVVSSVSVSPTSVERTMGLAIATTVKNLGRGPAASSSVRFYLSRSHTTKQATLLTGVQLVTPLGKRASLAGNTTATIPYRTRVGRYFLLACADAQKKVREANERNNCRASSARVSVTAPKKPPDTTSSAAELIDEAVAKKKISVETGLVYKVFAAFTDPRLPTEYRGRGAAGFNDAVLRDVAENFGTLSAPTRQVLAPFLVPPFHHQSWWAMRHGVASTPSKRRVAGSVSDIPPCQSPDLPLFAYWHHTETTNGKAKIWWFHPEDAQVANRIAGVIDYSWGELQKLMGKEPVPDGGDTKACRGGDDALDISLVDELSVPGMTFALNGCSESPAAISLKRGGGPTTSTVVHELMHAFQFAFKVQGSCPEYGWWRDATAEWAVDYVYPKDNGEHPYARSFLWAPDKPLELANSSHEYGAYVFPFFLARTFAPRIVRSTWEAFASHKDSLQAINDVIQDTLGGNGFEENWPRFAFYNWNRPPVDYYSQWDSLACPDCARPGALDGSVGSSDTEIPVRLEGGSSKEFELTGTVAHLAARYVDFKFTDDDVRSVSFYNGFSSSDPTHYRVQALVKIGGQWRLEQWSNRKGVAYCRDVADERLEELVLILSNSRFKDRGAAAPLGDTKLVATNVGCWRWRGRVTATVHLAVAGQVQDETTAATDVVFERARAAGAPADDPPSRELFHVVSGSAHWTGTVSGACSGQASRDYSLVDPPAATPITNLALYPYDGPSDPPEDRLGYWGLGLSFAGNPGVLGGTIPVVCSDAESVAPSLTLYWLATSRPGEITYRQVAGDGSLDGVLTFEVEGVTSSWEWHLTPERQQ
jgi:hypothetical protein